MRKENEDLKSTLSEKDVKIRNLELEVEKLKNALAEATLVNKVEPLSVVEPTSSSAAGAAASAADEETSLLEGVVSSNSLSNDVDDVDLPHNSNSLTE